jgi:Fe-S cluster assembly protein SufD
VSAVLPPLPALPPLLDALRAFPVPGAESERAARGQALADVLAAGLPTQRAERWKYTSLRPLSARRFVPDAPAPALHPAVLADIPAPRLVFVNGRYEPTLSQVGALPSGVHVSAQDDGASPAGALAEASATAGAASPDAPRAGPATVAGAADALFERLNALLAAEGATVELRAGTLLPAPLHLVFASVPAEGDVAMHLRHRVTLGAGAQATLVEHHVSGGPHRHLANHAMDITLGDGARLLHARLQDEDAGATLFARTDAQLAASATYRRVDLELGAGLSRHDLGVRLQGDGASVDARGALLATGRSHVDTRLDIRHVARDTRCELLWRGLATDRGRLAFHGGIRIAAGADGAAASLSSKNLLLSEHAEVNTQPVLEIDADEVQAAHGATVGRLDPTALFYLRSRGLPLAEARALLTLAFCREALASLGDDALFALLSPRLEARLLALVDLP